MLDTFAEGSLCVKQPNGTQILIEEMATNGYQWSFERNKLSRAGGIYDVEALTTLAAQVEAITKRLHGFQIPQQQAPVMSCGTCGIQSNTMCLAFESSMGLLEQSRLRQQLQ